MIYGEKSNNNNESILKNNMFDFLLKQDSKYKRIKLISIVSVTLMIIIFFLFLIYYFFQTYNTTKVYRIYGESDNYIIDNGILIITRENTYFKLGNINFSDNNIIIYSKNNGEDKIIYKGDSNNVLVDYFGYNSAINLSNIKNEMDNLYIKIDNEEIKLKFVDDYKNDSLILKDEKNITEYTNTTQTNKYIPKFITDNFVCNNTTCNGEYNEYMVSYTIDSKTLNLFNDKYNVMFNISDNYFYYIDKQIEFDCRGNSCTCLSSRCENIDNIHDNYFNNYIVLMTR